jgi:hypothetical protein
MTEREKEPGQVAWEAHELRFAENLRRGWHELNLHQQGVWAAVEAAVRADERARGEALLERYMAHVYAEEGSTFASHYRDLDPETFTPEEIALLVQLSDAKTRRREAPG